MRCYTQNIDGLEAREGLRLDLARGKGNKRRFMKKHYEAPLPAQTQNTDFDGGCEVVQLHGDLDRLRCNMCATKYTWTDEATDIYLEGAAPKCEACTMKSDQRQATGKRGLTVGALRPNIVLYGEEHPSNTLLTPLIPFDIGSQPEVLIIMGTSLKVFGLQKVVRDFAKAVHAHKSGKGRVIFVNRTRPAESVWEGIIDEFVAMDCDEWVTDLKKRREDLWMRQGELELKVTKNTGVRRKRKSEMETELEDKPVKKAKIVVEIPQKVKGSQFKPKKESLAPIITTPPTTPHRRKSTNWKRQLPIDSSIRAILSPLAQAKRPLASPLVTPTVKGGRITPQQPLFSPITPDMTLHGSSNLKMHVHLDDGQLEIQESDHSENEPDNDRIQIEDDDTEQDVDADTPSRGVGGRRVMTRANEQSTAWPELSAILEDRQDEELARLLLAREAQLSGHIPEAGKSYKERMFPMA